jgi:hypothetical protein
LTGCGSGLVVTVDGSDRVDNVDKVDWEVGFYTSKTYFPKLLKVKKSLNSASL